MLSETQFKGLYSGRLAVVDHPQVFGMQVFGILVLQFKSELYAEQRVRLISMLEQARKDGASFSFVLQFHENVDFSGVDMTMFKEIYILCIEWGVQFQIVCGSTSLQSLNSFSRTAGIHVHGTLNDALLKCKKQYLRGFDTKMTRNIIVMENDPQQRATLVSSLLVDRFSAVDVHNTEMATSFIKHFGALIDGIILEFIYPEFNEVAIVKALKAVNPNAKVLIHTDVLDPRILNICQEYKITSVIKSPYQVQNLIKKYRNEFPERNENYLGFKEQ